MYGKFNCFRFTVYIISILNDMYFTTCSYMFWITIHLISPKINFISARWIWDDELVLVEFKWNNYFIKYFSNSYFGITQSNFEQFSIKSTGWLFNTIQTKRLQKGQQNEVAWCSSSSYKSCILWQTSAKHEESTVRLWLTGSVAEHYIPCIHVKLQLDSLA